MQLGQTDNLSGISFIFGSDLQPVFIPAVTGSIMKDVSPP